jgi:hypothetical protein
MSLPSVLAMVPEDSGGPYVIAAYVVFLTITVVYLSIMAQRLMRLSKQADEIEARLDRRDAEIARAGQEPAAVDPSTSAPNTPESVV